jgi:hypothetical protein
VLAWAKSLEGDLERLQKQAAHLAAAIEGGGGGGGRGGRGQKNDDKDDGNKAGGEGGEKPPIELYEPYLAYLHFSLSKGYRDSHKPEAFCNVKGTQEALWLEKETVRGLQEIGITPTSTSTTSAATAAALQGSGFSLPVLEKALSILNPATQKHASMASMILSAVKSTPEFTRRPSTGALDRPTRANLHPHVRVCCEQSGYPALAPWQLRALEHLLGVAEANDGARKSAEDTAKQEKGEF